MIRIQSRPDFDLAEAHLALQLHYGLSGRLSPLPGERDRNYLVELDSGARYVLKVSSPEEPRPTVAFETDLLSYLSAETHGLVPSVQAAKSGARLVEHEDGKGHVHQVRLLGYLVGDVLATLRPRPGSVLEALGRRVAELGSALGAYPDHPPHRADFDWALGAAEDVMRRGMEVLEDRQRAHILSVRDAYAAQSADFLGLGSQIIHGDINDHNVLVSARADGTLDVTGVIDLGDAHSAPRVFDLAIAIAYGILNTPDPFEAAAVITRGYHRSQALLPAEFEVLMTLVRARLGQSVCIAAWRRSQGQADEYHLVSEEPAWGAIEALSAVPTALATGILRDACGLEACARSARLSAWIAGQDARPVMDVPENPSQVGVLDLSVASPGLTGRDTEDTAEFSDRVFRHMDAAGLTLGIGRFLEPRAFYLTEAFAGRPGDPREKRTIHLGIDLFDEPGKPVYAPLAGTVRTVQENGGRLDYGPTVILEHQSPEGPFWTLYGHLERASVADLEVGTAVAAGDQIARIGPYPENGDWPPHLHLQIMTDLLGFEGEFPGVALPRERAVWASFSPDPNLILKLPHETTFLEPAAVPERRREHMGSSLSVSYSEPIHVVRGLGAYLYDVLGRAYLDGVNNVAHVGHEHPRVVSAGQRQMSVLNTNTRYLHESVLEYSERLTSLFPEPLSVCFFVNSGSEANELALRLARAKTGGTGVVALEGGYHGHTQGLIDVSHYKHAGLGGTGAPSWVDIAPVPDDYRGRYTRLDPARAARYAQHVADGFEALRGRDHAPAAFLAEPILSCAGQIEPPEGYLTAAYAHARAAGALCIADEVQIGFGRTGSHWWGFESQAVVPDIVTLGKPIGNGHPIGAVITTPEIAQAFDNGMEFFSTCGGNPVSSEIGCAVLDVIEEEGLMAHALSVGGTLKSGLAALATTHDVIGDVRGRGLFLGVEFVRDRQATEPAPAVAEYVVDQMQRRGILLSTDGPAHNVIKIKPPMCFSARNAARLIGELDAILTHDAVRARATD